MKRPIVLLFPLLLVFSVACSGGGNDAASDAKPAKAADQSQLIAAKCGVCHPADQGADMHLGKEGWTAIVKRMQQNASGLISDDEAMKIIDHLVRTRGPQ